MLTVITKELILALYFCIKDQKAGKVNSKHKPTNLAGMRRQLARKKNYKNQGAKLQQDLTFSSNPLQDDSEQIH